jgi:hypothetical protein
LEQQDRDDEKDGHEEGRDAEANEEEEEEEEKQDEDDEKVEHGEKEQETQKENDRKEEKDEDDDDDEEAKAKENKPAKEKTEAEKQDEDHEKVEHESAEQPVTKRDRTLKINSSDEVEPPKKVNKASLLSPEAGPGLDLVDRGAATAAGLGVPPATGHGESTSPLSPLSMAEEDARTEVTDREQNILADERGAKRGRNLSRHPSAEAAPPKKVNITTVKEEIGAAAAKRVEKEDEEEEKRQAELRTAQDQLKKCLDDEDYTGAAAVKENIAARMIATHATCVLFGNFLGYPTETPSSLFGPCP